MSMSSFPLPPVVFDNAVHAGLQVDLNELLATVISGGIIERRIGRLPIRVAIALPRKLPENVQGLL